MNIVRKKEVLKTSLNLTYIDFIFWWLLETMSMALAADETGRAEDTDLQRCVHICSRYLQKPCQEFEIGLISLEPLLADKLKVVSFSDVL
jgi:hypothetical protein